MDISQAQVHECTPDERARLTRYAEGMHELEHKLMDAYKVLKEADRMLKDVYVPETMRAEADKGWDKIARDVIETVATTGILLTSQMTQMKDVAAVAREDLLTVMREYDCGSDILGKIADDCDAKNEKVTKSSLN